MIFDYLFNLLYQVNPGFAILVFFLLLVVPIFLLPGKIEIKLYLAMTMMALLSAQNYIIFASDFSLIVTIAYGIALGILVYRFFS